MPRKLATIRRVVELKEIPGADLIELCIIDGWQAVVKKGEFQAGDLVVYLECDSFLPLLPQYEFLRKSSYKKMHDGTEGFRLKTIRIKQTLSQGLVLPIVPTLGKGIHGLSFPWHYEGDDVTNVLDIKLWETPPAGVSQGQGKGGLPENAKGAFPSWIPKTEEERIQNCWKNLPKDVDYIATEKLHGTSATFYLRDDEFGVCSRNLDLKPEMGGLYTEVAEQLGIEAILRKHTTDAGAQAGIAIQGEIIGEGINGNYYGLKGRQFFLFNIYSAVKNAYAPHEYVVRVTEQIGLQHVPVLNERYRLPDTCAEALAGAEGPSVYSRQPVREGLVLRHYPVHGPRISCKVISNAYLLNEK